MTHSRETATTSPGSNDTLDLKTSSGRPMRPAGMALKALDSDNADLMAEVISTIEKNPHQWPELQRDHLQKYLDMAVRRKSINIATRLLSQGADAHSVYASSLDPTDASTFMEIVALLLRHGWDINTRRKKQSGCYDGLALLWCVLENEQLVRWCLQRGASVLPKGQRKFTADEIQSTTGKDVDDDVLADYFSCPPILETAAEYSSVEIFEHLRSNGAPLGPGMLHRAARNAIVHRGAATSHQERMAMVRHLVETLGVDVNGSDQPAGKTVPAYYPNMPGHLGTPLCHVAHRTSTATDCADVTRYLLARGADPWLRDPWGSCAMSKASGEDGAQFRQIVQSLENASEIERDT